MITAPPVAKGIHIFVTCFIQNAANDLLWQSRFSRQALCSRRNGRQRQVDSAIPPLPVAQGGRLSGLLLGVELVAVGKGYNQTSEETAPFHAGDVFAAACHGLRRS